MAKQLKTSYQDHEITMEAMEIFYERHPEYWERYGERGREKAYQDWLFHLSYLAAAINANEPNLFIDYLAWCKMFFKSINFPEKYLLESFEILLLIFDRNEPKYGTQAKNYLTTGLEKFNDLPDEINSFLDQDTELAVLAQQYLNSLLRGDRNVAANLIFDAIEHGIPIKKIYLQVFQPVQYEVGRLWHLNKINVAKEHYCTAVTQNIIARLYAHLFTGQKSDKKIIATCAPGELHELGIRMVADFFQMEGWDTYFLGANTPMESLIETLSEIRPDILALSATVAFNVNKLATIIDSIRNTDGISDIKVMVGGYPFIKNPDLWKTIGANAFAKDAQQAIEVADKLIA
ncbi:MAG: cobalamin-dependent protein [Candidatus Marinimicrobia bacterium]|nr:cobalamin-dependent protein [Candidatus Neomarinimicrobiota bacterium]